jgi:hypothetical protein
VWQTPDTPDSPDRKGEDQQSNKYYGNRQSDGRRIQWNLRGELMLGINRQNDRPNPVTAK